jgi:class 3 adenylate cyclase
MTDWDDIRSEVGSILTGRWETRDGAKVPQPEELQLGKFAVKLNGTVLYADLADSTGLVNTYYPWFSAEVYEAFLRGACRLIQRNHGEITAFDGDRVMAVYIGDNRTTNAVWTALEINWFVRNLLNPELIKRYALKDFELAHAVGVDQSPLFVARTGVRGSNDLVWVGRSANYAAKLSGLCDTNYRTYITKEVLDAIPDSVRVGTNRQGKTESMWSRLRWTAQSIDIYGSNWYRGPA